MRKYNSPLFLFILKLVPISIHLYSCEKIFFNLFLCLFIIIIILYQQLIVYVRLIYTKSAPREIITA